MGLCLAAGRGQHSVFYPAPPSLSLLKFHSFLWHRKLSVWNVHSLGKSLNCVSEFCFPQLISAICDQVLACAHHGRDLGLAGAFSHVSIIDINEILSVPIMDIHGEGRESLASSFFPPSFIHKFNFPCYSLDFSGQSDASWTSFWFCGL